MGDGSVARAAIREDGPDQDVEDPHLGELVPATGKLALEPAQGASIAVEIVLVARGRAPWRAPRRTPSRRVVLLQVRPDDAVEHGNEGGPLRVQRLGHLREPDPSNARERLEEAGERVQGIERCRSRQRRVGEILATTARSRPCAREPPRSRRPRCAHRHGLPVSDRPRRTTLSERRPRQRVLAGEPSASRPLGWETDRSSSSTLRCASTQWSSCRPRPEPVVLGNLREAIRPGGLIDLTVEQIGPKRSLTCLAEARAAGAPVAYGEDLPTRRDSRRVGCRPMRRVGHEATLRRLGPVRNASWTGTPDLLPDAILLGKSARVGNGTVAGVKLSTCA